VWRVILELAGAVERLGVRCEEFEERSRRLEEQVRRYSRTSSRPPSSDPPKTRQQRRAEAVRLGASGGALYTDDRWPD
jgi:hypothetical protein